MKKLMMNVIGEPVGGYGYSFWEWVGFISYMIVMCSIAITIVIVSVMVITDILMS